MQIIQIMRLKIIVFIHLWTLIAALIRDEIVEVPPLSVSLVDAFAFRTGGNYYLQISSDTPTNNSEILLMVSGKGDDCDTIGKTCSYNIFKMSDICSKVTASTLNSTILGAYPILIPSYAYTPLGEFSTYTFNSSSWESYVPAGWNFLKDYLDTMLMPAVLQTLPFNVTYSHRSTSAIDNSTNSTNTINNATDPQQQPQNIVRKISNVLSGSIGRTAQMYFAILNCNNESFVLSVSYSFVNPAGEQLPTTEIPYKV